MAGPTVAALRIAGPVPPWRAIGFTVAEDGVCRIGAVELRLGSAGAGITGWSLTGAGDGDVDGIPTEWLPAAPTESAPLPAHANTAVSVDHVVVRSADVAATCAALARSGMRLRGERVAGEPGQGVRQAFFRHGEAIIEVVGPEPAQTPAPSTLWGLTVTVAELDACAERLGERLGAIRAAVQPGRRIATARRDSGLGVPLAFMSR